MFILIALLVLGFLIFVHELGHFTVAKLAGIQVDEFSIGFGPSIISRLRAGTKYSLRLLPLGGYVKMAGMEPNEDHVNGFNKKSLAARIAVIMAGSLSNFLVAVLLFILTFSLIGNAVPSNANIIGDVNHNSPAANAGLKAGDRIVRIDGVNTINWNGVASIIRNKAGQPVTMVVERNNKSYSFVITPKYDPELKISRVGILPTIEWERQSFVSAVTIGLKSTIDLTHMILLMLAQMVTGNVSAQNIAGPVGIVQQIGESARGGPGTLLMVTGFLGINLAIFNLLPIPALDGSRLVFLLLEGVRGRPIDPEKENLIHLVGFALLMGLILLVTYNDIARLLSGG